MDLTKVNSTQNKKKIHIDVYRFTFFAWVDGVRRETKVSGQTIVRHNSDIIMH